MAAPFRSNSEVYSMSRPDLPQERPSFTSNCLEVRRFDPYSNVACYPHSLASTSQESNPYRFTKVVQVYRKIPYNGTDLRVLQYPTHIPVRQYSNVVNIQHLAQPMRLVRLLKPQVDAGIEKPHLVRDRRARHMHPENVLTANAGFETLHVNQQQHRPITSTGKPAYRKERNRIPKRRSEQNIEKVAAEALLSLGQQVPRIYE